MNGGGAGRAGTGPTERRYEALAAAPGPELEALADRILAGLPDGGVEVLAGPEVGAGPVRLAVPGTAAGTVVVGQLAVTRATVSLAGGVGPPGADRVRGDGLRPGRDLTGALAAAVCDAEAGRGGPLAPAVEHLVAGVLLDRAEARRREAEIVAATRLAGPA